MQTRAFRNRGGLARFVAVGAVGSEHPWTAGASVRNVVLHSPKRPSWADSGEWCNGSTADSGSACLGSNPSSPACDEVYGAKVVL